MAKDEIQTRLETMAAEAASTRGVEVVEVVYRRQGRHSVLRVDIDRPGTPGVTLEDCEAVSHALDALLEADDPFGEVPYDLQVSSPGLDRPIRTPDDVRRNAGRRVIVNTRVPIEGRRSFKGVLAGGDAAGFRVLRDDIFSPGMNCQSISEARKLLGLMRWSHQRIRIRSITFKHGEKKCILRRPRPFDPRGHHRAVRLNHREQDAGTRKGGRG